ncbi:MAG: T9SS type A sorting domain-containing protein [Patescibacteria group bacterium]|nr:T9SS type A sorting domain-containing protein [Patescibacteria group bacterium]
MRTSIILLFLALLTAILPVSGQVQQPATFDNWYSTLNALYHWDALNIPEATMPDNGDIAFRRAAALNLLCCGNAPNQILTYEVVRNNLNELFFSDLWGDWWQIKNRLTNEFKINIDSLEATARGISDPNFYIETWDTMSTATLLNFGLIAHQTPTLLMPAASGVSEDSIGIKLTACNNRLSIAGFQTSLHSNVEWLDSLIGYNNFRIISQRNYSRYAIGGLRNNILGVDSSSFQLAKVFAKQTNAGKYDIFQEKTVFADTAGEKDFIGWPHKSLILVYDRADANQNFTVSISDAVMCSRWLLYDISPPITRLGDMNYNGLLDADDPWLILERSLNGSGKTMFAATTQSNANEPAQGIIKVRIGKNSEKITVIISFEGEAEQSKRFGGILSFDENETNLKLIDIKFNQPIFEPLSGYKMDKNKLKILCYLQPKNGRLVTINFERLTNRKTVFELLPLVQNFFTFDEKISVQYKFVSYEEINKEIPEKFKLYQNYPNPFNPSTKIAYELPKTSSVTIRIFNVLGAEVAKIIKGYEAEGKYEILFNSSGLSSGIYTYRLETDSFIDQKKMIILK